MDFTIDDMIEFCKNERDYHCKEADKRKEICFKNETPEGHSYMLGNHIGFKIAYGNMAESLVKLKENCMNEKIKELIDWCQTETDDCIEDMKDNSLSDKMWSFAAGKKTILDEVKDKLCSIYEEDNHAT